MRQEEIINLAAEHGLRLGGEMSFNDMGVDFRVVFAEDTNGKKWVLRIPRRLDLAEQIEHEKSILQFVKKRLSVSVPDWQIATPRLIAYPLLEDKPVLTFSFETYEVSWNTDKDHPNIVPSIAQMLVELHSISVTEAKAAGIKIVTPENARREILDNIYHVKTEIGISDELENRWRKWVDDDDLWPDFSTFIHGDLYAGHILANSEGNATGMIDWSEARVSDLSIDLAGHISAFGEDSLKELIRHYENAGGRLWKNLFEQTVERHSASALKYAVFALEINNDEHITAAKNQLGLS